MSLFTKPARTMTRINPFSNEAATTDSSEHDDALKATERPAKPSSASLFHRQRLHTKLILIIISISIITINTIY